VIQKETATEWVEVQVSGKEGSLQVDVTADPVWMAFMGNGDEPVAADWNTAGWNRDDSTTPTKYFARCLVGPDGGFPLSIGRYAVWVKWEDNPETPIHEVGVLQIT
jgi:hypothetical protein